MNLPQFIVNNSRYDGRIVTKLSYHSYEQIYIFPENLMTRAPMTSDLDLFLKAMSGQNSDSTCAS